MAEEATDKASNSLTKPIAIGSFTAVVLSALIWVLKGQTAFVQDTVSGKLDDIKTAIKDSATDGKSQAVGTAVALTKAADAMNGMTDSLSDLRHDLSGLVKVQTKQVDQVQAQLEAKAEAAK